MPDAWELFPHGADVGIRGHGATVARAFEQAALALTSVVTDPETVEPRARVDIECRARDLELLFFDWISRLVVEMSVEGMLFGRFGVEIEDGRLIAHAEGERVDRARHQPAVEVKGATMTELSVRTEPGGEWVAQCVVDV